MENNVMEQTQETKKTLFSVEQNGFTSYYDMGVMSFEELRQHFMESEHPFMGLGGKELSEADFAQLEQSDKVSLSVTADIDNDVIQIYEINGITEEERTRENTRIWEMELSEYVSEKQIIETNIGSIPIEDYREIVAGQHGFDSYESMYKAGYRLGNNLDKAPDNFFKSENVEETLNQTTENQTLQNDKLPYDYINTFEVYSQGGVKERIELKVIVGAIPTSDIEKIDQLQKKYSALNGNIDGFALKDENGKTYFENSANEISGKWSETVFNQVDLYYYAEDSSMRKAERIINRMEVVKSVFNNDERCLIVNYAYKLNDMEKTRELAECIFYNHGNQEAILAKDKAQAEIDALPDPMIGISQMNEYGYTNKDMLPLTQEGAMELFEQNLSVYVLHKDGMETMVEDREQIMEHAGIFGIEKDEWLQMHPQREIRETANQNKSQERTEKKNSMLEQSNKKESVQQAGKKESVLSKLKLFQSKAKEQNEAKETPTRNKETGINK